MQKIRTYDTRNGLQRKWNEHEKKTTTKNARETQNTKLLRRLLNATKRNLIYISEPKQNNVKRGIGRKWMDTVATWKKKYTKRCFELKSTRERERSNESTFKRNTNTLRTFHPIHSLRAIVIIFVVLYFLFCFGHAAYNLLYWLFFCCLCNKILRKCSRVILPLSNSINWGQIQYINDWLRQVKLLQWHFFLSFLYAWAHRRFSKTENFRS